VKDVSMREAFAPISDYAAIGDRRAVALVRRSGSIDWFCTPSVASPSVFAALLDPARGGRFALAPEVPFTSERRYLADTNVLETIFVTGDGTVRVTDSLNLDNGTQLPWRELARRVECLSGSVPLRWEVSPRFDYGSSDAVAGRCGEVVCLTAADGHALVVSAWNAGSPILGDGTVSASVLLQAGEHALLALLDVGEGPRVLVQRDSVEKRIDVTATDWRRFAAAVQYDGPWRDDVVRSALALELLADASTGGIFAAATTSLPERVGGGRNYDYRFCWLRDMSFTLDALLNLGLLEQAHASYRWLLGATARTHPRLQPFYTLDGSAHPPERTLDLQGWCGSTPVRVGNGAAGQLQLGNFGDFFGATMHYVDRGHALDPETGARMADAAQLVCAIWRHDDAGIWELHQNRPYTISKMSCWAALDRAVELAARGQVPAQHTERWRRERDTIHRYVESECWSERRGAYTFYAGSDELDASLAVAPRLGYPGGEGRIQSTLAAIRSELGAGPHLYRYSGQDSQENCFVACAFWEAEALARLGRSEDAAELIDALLPHSNDVGLWSEEIDPVSGDLFGNTPQALSHLALINSACATAGS
jgi:GH15 family glucan-1,4-alpha-glucosidase